MRVEICLQNGLLCGMRAVVDVVEVSDRHVVVRMPRWGKGQGRFKRFFLRSGCMCGRPQGGDIWKILGDSRLTISGT